MTIFQPPALSGPVKGPCLAKRTLHRPLHLLTLEAYVRAMTRTAEGKVFLERFGSGRSSDTAVARVCVWEGDWPRPLDAAEEQEVAERSQCHYLALATVFWMAPLNVNLDSKGLSTVGSQYHTAGLGLAKLVATTVELKLLQGILQFCILEMVSCTASFSQVKARGSQPLRCSLRHSNSVLALDLQHDLRAESHRPV